MDKYCALRSGGLSWDDFREKGFTVVPGFLSETDISTLLTVYEQMQDDSITNPGGNNGNKVGYKSAWAAGLRLADLIPHAAEKIYGITAHAQQEAGIHISDPRFEEMFFTTNSSDWSRSLNFGWHQDLENFFFFQDLRNYLDFYIFLLKPDPDQAGVSLVPWDALQASSPEFYSLARIKRGVFGFHDFGEGKTLATEGSTDSRYLLDFSLDQISCSPRLHAGDLLLFAGDAIHRTQAHSSWRISLNINVHQDYPKSSASIAELLRGGSTKYSFMAQNFGQYVGLHKSRISQQRGIQTSDPALNALEIALRAYVFVGSMYRKALHPVRVFLGT